MEDQDIIKAFVICNSTQPNCVECPYALIENCKTKCKERLNKDVFYLLTFQQETIEDLEDTIKLLEAELLN